MKTFMVCSALVLGLLLGAAHAGEIREIVLKDGSVIAGEVLSLTNGIYTLKSDVLGTIKIEESKIRLIREKSPGGQSTINNGTTGEVKSLQDKMMSDKEVMDLIQSLQNDPEFKKLLEDPEIVKAVNAGDVAALTADPRFMKLLNNPTVQEIQKKVK
jgi:hypothetical protein